MLGAVTPASLFGVFVCGLVLRLVAYHYHWKLPKP